MARCLISTFYAYKGGTGRTLALANVARYLAEEMGYRVGLVDLDIDSPGLVHEALCADLDVSLSRAPNKNSSRSDGGASSKGKKAKPSSDVERRTALLESINAREGFVELFSKSIRQEKETGSISPDIREYVISLNSGCSGSILLMPAGAGSVRKEAAYGQKIDIFMQELAAIKRRQPGGRNVSSPGQISSKIFEEFTKQFDLDFLFLDGRTGTGTLFPVYVYSIPHLLVLFVGLNDQNVTGSLSILNAKTSKPTSPAPVFLVVSPVPTVGPAQLEQRLTHIASELNEIRKSRDSTDEHYIYGIPFQADHLLPYSDAAAFGEVYFPGRYPHSFLAAAHEKLARRIERLVLRDETNEPGVSSEDSDPLESYFENAQALIQDHRPLIIATEDVHRDILLELIEAKFNPELRPECRFLPAEDGKAPWEVAVEAAKDDKTKELEHLLNGTDSEFPDVLMIPQIHLEALGEALEGKFLHDLGALRLAEEEGLIDYAELDSNYSGWRRWCSVGQRVVALPFSINATLLCANEERFVPFCEAYWKQRGQTPKSPFFVPSSWQCLLEVIRSSALLKKQTSAPFRIVGEKRGLYYEWLNVVTSLGGFDLEQVEGRVIQRMGFERRETIEATKLFIKLARLSSKQSPKATSMFKQIESFGERLLPLYVGWTDSFRFAWGESLPTRTTIIGQKEPGEKMTIHLAPSPRDMHHQRSSLVDAWLMTFPNKKGSPNRLKTALSFARWFLEPQQQTKLLGQGFPSPCTSVVNRAVESLSAARLASSVPPAPAERSYRVFLETLQVAARDGNWVASPKAGAYELVVDAVSKLVNDDKCDTEMEMKELATRVDQIVKPKDRFRRMRLRATTETVPEQGGESR
jgi:hypothetical protein